MRQQFTILAFALAITALLAGCNRNPPPAETSLTETAGSSQAQPSQPEAEPEPAEDLMAVQPNIPAPMGAAMYRGTVTERIDLDGGMVLKLAQYQGTDFGSRELTVALNDDTKSNFDLDTLEEGNYLEVYYGVSEGEQADEDIAAIAINRLGDAGMVNFNGTVNALLPDEDSDSGQTGSILMTALDGEEEMLFHYDQDTQFYLDFAAIVPEDALTIFYSGITTRSIPPQATALEVRPLAPLTEELE